MLYALLQGIKDFFVVGFWSLLVVLAILRACLTRILLDLESNGYLRYLPSRRTLACTGVVLGVAAIFCKITRRQRLRCRTETSAGSPRGSSSSRQHQESDKSVSDKA
ncbi:hypothetical protein FA15DRAFT_674973 [Coprinopsis marcescibilis]|uniref:Uncharacterized protein n=1 Tax=Coprinopsis marcescibilis TaxID=230819 RepID=A0A5C3KFT7_COPMA|nr:hypothetical protein FA15DRAFT_674973 [Coprinopsis marcescibilis]